MGTIVPASAQPSGSFGPTNSSVPASSAMPMIRPAIANHAGSLPYDSAMVMHAIRRDHPARRDVRPLVEDAVFHLPWLGPLMQRIGGVRASPENAERLIGNGEVVTVFPEGIKGIGKDLAQKIREIATTGTTSVFEELKARIPLEVVSLTELQGLGPKRVKTLFEVLGVRTRAGL